MLHRLDLNGLTDSTFGDGGSIDLPGPMRRLSGSRIPFVFDAQDRIWVAASGRLIRLSEDGDFVPSPFGGEIPFEEGWLGFDAAGRLIVGRETSVARYDFADRIEIGRDNVLYLTGDGAASDIASVTLGCAR